MKPFLTLDETNIDKNLSASSREGYRLREAARAVVFDGDGAVALLHVTRDGYYKLPGGGIDEGETPCDALERELLEEIGCRTEVTHELGTVVEQRYYWNMTQVSYCFTARVVGEKGEPDFTDSERERGFEVVWAKNIDDAIHLLGNSKDKPLPEDELGITFMRLRETAIARRAKTTLKK